MPSEKNILFPHQKQRIQRQKIKIIYNIFSFLVLFFIFLLSYIYRLNYYIVCIIYMYLNEYFIKMNYRLKRSVTF